jgi:hemolysin D
LLHGQVLSVSQDALVRETQPDSGAKQKELGAESTSSEPKGEELSYVGHISLERTKIQVDDTLANLSPGMAVTLEIKTGRRGILS